MQIDQKIKVALKNVIMQSISDYQNGKIEEVDPYIEIEEKVGENGIKAIKTDGFCEPIFDLLEDFSDAIHHDKKYLEWSRKKLLVEDAIDLLLKCSKKIEVGDEVLPSELIS